MNVACAVSSAPHWTRVGRVIEKAHKALRQKNRSHPTTGSCGRVDNECGKCNALMCLHTARLETDPILAPVVPQRIPVGCLSD